MVLHQKFFTPKYFNAQYCYAKKLILSQIFLRQKAYFKPNIFTSSLFYAKNFCGRKNLGKKKPFLRTTDWFLRIIFCSVMFLRQNLFTPKSLFYAKKLSYANFCFKNFFWKIGVKIVSQKNVLWTEQSHIQSKKVTAKKIMAIMAIIIQFFFTYLDSRFAVVQLYICSICSIQGFRSILSHHNGI